MLVVECEGRWEQNDWRLSGNSNGRRSVIAWCFSLRAAPPITGSRWVLSRRLDGGRRR